MFQKSGRRLLLASAVLGAAVTICAAANAEPTTVENASEAQRVLARLVEDAAKIDDIDGSSGGEILLLAVRARYSGYGSLCRTHTLDIRTDPPAPGAEVGRIHTISEQRTYRTIDAPGAPLGEADPGAAGHLDELCRASEDKGADFQSPSDYEAWRAVQLIAAIKATPTPVLARIAKPSCGATRPHVCGDAAATAKHVVNRFLLASARRNDGCLEKLPAGDDCEELVFQQEDAESTAWRITVGFSGGRGEAKLRFVRVSGGEGD